LPVALVAVAALLRLYRLNLAEYRGDDDDMVTAATQALHQGWLQAHGLISSVPIDNGPVAMWLLMLPLAITSSLLVAQIWVALLNVGSVALCYHVVCTVWNRPLALVATALYAVSPWAVIYSRRLWITAFDAPLALLAFWLLFRWLQIGGSTTSKGASATGVAAGDGATPNGKMIAFPTERMAPSWRRSGRHYLPPVLCALAFSAFFQAHVVPMGEVVTLLVVFLFFFRAFGIRRIIVCLATLAVTMAPYVLTTVLPALGKSLAGQQARHPGVDFQSWLAFGNLVTGRGYQSIAPQGSRLLDATALPFTIIDWFAVTLLLIGGVATAVGVFRAVRARDRAAARGATLLLWALVPPLGLMVHLVEIHPYYFVVSMPAISILEGCGVMAVAQLVARRFRRLRASAVAAGATSLLVASQIALAAPFFAVLPEFWPGADYGLPLQTTVKLTAMARTFAAGTLAVVGGYDHDVDETLYSTLGRAFPGARYADDRGILEYAASGPALLYLTTDDQSWEATTLRDRFAGSQVGQVRLPGEGRIFRFFRPSTGAMLAWVQQAAPALKTPAPFGTAAELTGAAVQGAVPGATAHVTLNWHLLQEPAQPLLMRLELTGNDGYVWTSTDAVSYPAGYWHAGDASRLAFLDRIDLPLPAYLPPGGYDVRVRLLGIADGKQFGAPAVAGSLTISPAQAVAAAGAAAPVPTAALPHATAAAIAPGLRLVGWNVDRTSVQQNDVLGVTLFWRVDGPVTQAPPLHLRAPNGAAVAVADSSELVAALPPARWPPGAARRYG
jgi:4-amino-4-deoxy-L-arabinose transferase-like glycosyltransferase